MTLESVYDAIRSAQDAQNDAQRLTRLTIALEAATNAVAALEARVAHLERTRPAEVDPLRLLDLSEVARRLGFARATVTKMRSELPIIDLPSGKGTLPFVRERELLDWLEAHKRKATP